MKKIELTQGKHTIVDEEDMNRLEQRNWQARKDKRTWYAYGWDISLKHHIAMHREIWEHKFGTIPNELMIDHINKNGLDNRKNNLRLCSIIQNMRNSRKYNRSDATSKFKGVNLYKPNGRWCARIRVDRRLHHLGYFDSEIDAAIAYNTAAEKYFGAFASLNNV